MEKPLTRDGTEFLYWSGCASSASVAVAPAEELTSGGEEERDRAMKPITPEQRCIVAAQKGDMEAFEALVREFQGAVVSTAYHLVGNEADADDVAQEVWIRVFRSLLRFRFRSRFSTWLYRITVNQSLTFLKKRNRQPGGRKKDIALDDPDREYPLRDKSPGPRHIMEGKESVREFRRALDALPTRQRLAVTLVLIQGISHREAGKIIGIAEKTVSWHLFKARERLTEDLRDIIVEE